MSVVDWEVQFILSEDAGSLWLNQLVTFPSGTGIYIINPAQSKTEIPLRVTDTNLPQSDGEQLHHRFFAGYLMRLAIQLWESEEQPACDELLQEMGDELLQHIRAYQAAADGRVYWTPVGEAQRMIKGCLLNEYADITLEDGGVTQIAFQVKSTFPYAVDAATGTIPIV